MDRLKYISISGMACLALTFFSAISWADSTPCEKNFTAKEGVLGRQIYNTWQVLPEITPQKAFRRAYIYLIREGWAINLTDKEFGIISASQQGVSSGEGGKAAPLNVLIEDLGDSGGGLSPKGIKATVTFSIPGGLHASEDGVRRSFCDMLADIKR